MPVNFQEIQPQVRHFGEQAVLRESHLGDLRQKMHAELDKYAYQPDALREKSRACSGI